MQIDNFYTDPVPSVRNPLDCIVLSPHTINANDFGLTDPEKDSNDYRSVLPSIYSCDFHGQDTRGETHSISKSIWNKCRTLFKC